MTRQIVMPPLTPAPIGEAGMCKGIGRVEPLGMLLDRRREPRDGRADAVELVVARGERQRQILRRDVPREALEQLAGALRVAALPIEVGEVRGELGERLVEGQRALVERDRLAEAFLLLQGLGEVDERVEEDGLPL